MAESKRAPIVVREFSIMPNGEFVHGRRLPPPLPKRDASVVSLCFFRPVRQASVHRCTYEIRKNNKVLHRFSVLGIDAVGALRRAMRAAVSVLEIRYLNEWRVSVPKEYFDDMRSS